MFNLKNCNTCTRPKDLFHHILTVGAGKMSIFNRQVIAAVYITPQSRGFC